MMNIFSCIRTSFHKLRPAPDPHEPMRRSVLDAAQRLCTCTHLRWAEAWIDEGLFSIAVTYRSSSSPTLPLKPFWDADVTTLTDIERKLKEKEILHFNCADFVLTALLIARVVKEAELFLALNQLYYSYENDCFFVPNDIPKTRFYTLKSLFKKAKPGDLIALQVDTIFSHIMIYRGNGSVFHAWDTKNKPTTSNLSRELTSRGIELDSDSLYLIELSILVEQLSYTHLHKRRLTFIEPVPLNAGAWI